MELLVEEVDLVGQEPLRGLGWGEAAVVGVGAVVLVELWESWTG